MSSTSSGEESPLIFTNEFKSVNWVQISRIELDGEVEEVEADSGVAAN